ncbi:putative Tubulin Polyglutamylase Ttll2 [Manis pentadactyla]|nr:putative Tubulin Polyglutamylase Ttll2 [Manis pentadactyla]
MLDRRPTDQASLTNEQLSMSTSLCGLEAAGIDETAPAGVQSVLLERGWDRFHKGEQDVEDWDLHWRLPTFRMARHLKHMWRVYGSRLYEFLLLTCVVPDDYGKFMAENFKEKPCRAGRPSQLRDLQVCRAVPWEGNHNFQGH